MGSFAHWPVIPIQALWMIRKYPAFKNTKLLFHLIRHDVPLVDQINLFSLLSLTINDMKQMARHLKSPLNTNYFNKFLSRNELERAHSRMVAYFNKSHKALEINHHFFPVSPLIETDDIKHIISNHALIREGRSMHHCVGSYIGRAQSGNSYFYQVLKPERGTLQVSMINGQAIIEQFKLAHNNKPSKASQLYVLQWLSKYKNIS